MQRTHDGSWDGHEPEGAKRRGGVKFADPLFFSSPPSGASLPMPTHLTPAEQALREAALEYHRAPTRGKIAVTPTKPLLN